MVRIGLPSAGGLATGIFVAVAILALFPRAGILGSMRCPVPKPTATNEQVRASLVELSRSKEEAQQLQQQLEQHKSVQAESERRAQEEATGLKEQLEAARKEAEAAKGQLEDAKKETERVRDQAEAQKREAEGLKQEVEKLKQGGPKPKGDDGWRKPMAIPRILHHNFNDRENMPEHYKDWMHNCKVIMSEEQGWKYILWDRPMSEELIGKHDPDFLQIFKNYTRNVQRSDSLRYFIMKHVGGLYLDADVECWREGSDMLEGYDVVIQGDYPGHAATNGLVASAPGHPVWDVAIGLLKERKDHDPNDLGYSTGPQIVRDAVKRLLNVTLDEHALLPSDLTHSDGTKIKVWQIGEWFTPCGFSSADCMRDIMLQRATGRIDLTHLVGMHRYTASWLGFSDGQHPISPEALKKAIQDLKKDG